jgi:diguanylate cyclase (GGDEF)-like protein
MPKRRDQVILTVLAGPHMGAIFRLDGGQAIIGRGDEATLSLPDDRSLSWRHACVFERDGKLFLEDLQSTNGTFIGLERVRGVRPLENGARIGLGRTVLKLELQDALEAAVTEQLYESMVTDPLTGARNRLAFNERLRMELAYAIRHQTPVSVIMMDIDHFKRINDTHGHPAGDAVLCEIVSTLQRSVRTEDLLARYGGEELVVVARGINRAQAWCFAERLRNIVAHTGILHGGVRIDITASFGVATAAPDTPLYEASQLVAAADQALYRAKQGGRNRVFAWGT